MTRILAFLIIISFSNSIAGNTVILFNEHLEVYIGLMRTLYRGFFFQLVQKRDFIFNSIAWHLLLAKKVGGRIENGAIWNFC